MALRSLITAMGVTVSIVVASVLTAAAGAALATLSKEFMALMVIAGVLLGVVLAVLASDDDE